MKIFRTFNKSFTKQYLIDKCLIVKEKNYHEMNVIPYIDVMLVLLLVLMIAAPLMSRFRSKLTWTTQKVKFKRL